MAIFTSAINELQFEDGTIIKVDTDEVDQVLSNLRAKGVEVAVI